MTDKELQKHKEYQKKLSKNIPWKEKTRVPNSKKEQSNFDKNAVLAPPKTHSRQACMENIICILLINA